ncbi:MAG TPA: hypothetical protein VK797_25665 [Tepidisphaeraceae bacterium]|jgi:hypothetical protein|nr:hypothetical protein [Tepidisphaeraceae bacterium]
MKELAALGAAVRRVKTVNEMGRLDRRIKRYLDSSARLRAATNRHLKKETLALLQKEFPALMRVVAEYKKHKSDTDSN